MDSLPDVFSKLPIGLQWAIAVVLALSAIGFPLSTIGRWLWRLRMFLWPDRKNWVAQCVPTPPNSDIHGQPDSDPNNAWRKDRGRWSNGKPMEVGDYFDLRFDKPRALSEITIHSEGQRFPKVIKFLTKDDRNRQWELEIESTIDVKQHNEETIFQHRFKTHRKVAAIRLEIIEPTLEPRNNKGYSPAWAIYSIDFKVYRLFGCLWEGGL